MSNKSKSKGFPLHGNICIHNFAVPKLCDDFYTLLYFNSVSCLKSILYLKKKNHSAIQITKHFDICQFLCLILLKSTCFVNNLSPRVSLKRKNHPQDNT